MKRQSMRAAMRCETAKGKTCRCRCGGKLHGAARGIDSEDPKFYELLPKEDPHFALAKGKKPPKALPLFDDLGEIA